MDMIDLTESLRRIVFCVFAIASVDGLGLTIPVDLPGFDRAHVICDEPGAWILSAFPRSEGNGVIVVDLSLESPIPCRPPSFALEYELPGVGADHVWAAFEDRYMLYASGFGGRTHYTSQLAYQTPVLEVFGDEGSNVLAVACSEALRKMTFGIGISEKTCELQGSFRFMTEDEPPVRTYRASVRFDRRRSFWASAVAESSEWVSSANGFKPCPVPEAAFDPLYSTWYAYLQDVDANELEQEASLAAAIGMRTVILDDGWQKRRSASFYSATGDWMPAHSRFPDMKAHVAKVHAEGLRYLLWLSVPYVGDESAAWKRFQGKFLRVKGEKSPGRVGVLDPRFPEVREYLLGTYEHVVREWGFDGLKLDFIDQFVIKGEDAAKAENYRGRDFRSLPEAVDRLMRDVVVRLSAIRPDVLLEFRQQYMGPAIRQYGNMIRATDSPADSDRIRKQIADLRLTSGDAAVHADMLVWHPAEPPERAARPILNSLFSVIQYSMVLNRLPEEHRAVVRHWIDFTQKHRQALLHGRFIPYHPELLYPRLEGESAAEKVIALYSIAQPVDVGDLVKPVILVNATFERKIPVAVSAKAVVCCYDVMGRNVGTGEMKKGICFLDIPVSGYAEIRPAGANVAEDERSSHESEIKCKM